MSRKIEREKDSSIIIDNDDDINRLLESSALASPFANDRERTNSRRAESTIIQPTSNNESASSSSTHQQPSYFGTTVLRLYWERTLWLVGLLLLQSYASLILEVFEALLKKHLVITLFLPMLIGAGGNASNQSAMIVVRGLATGEVMRSNVFQLIVREFTLALAIGLTMMCVAYLRVYLFHSSDGNSAALAVGASTMAVMLMAIGLGTMVPLAMNLVGIDPAHAGPVVSVLVDLSGVAVICFVCNAVLD